MTFGERITNARRNAGLSQKNLAEILDITPTRLNYWEKDKREPDIEMLLRLSETLKIGLDELLGNVKLSDAPDDGLSADARLVGEKFDKLDDFGRKVVNSVTDLELERVSSGKIVPISAAGKALRHYLTPSAAGYSSPIEGEEFEDIFDENAPDGADFCIELSGDSMEPYLHDGERIYVRRDASLANFDVGIFYLDGDVLCKQICEDSYNNIYLLSANPDRQDANRIVRAGSNSAFVCFGKVITPRKLPPVGYDF